MDEQGARYAVWANGTYLGACGGLSDDKISRLKHVYHWEGRGGKVDVFTSPDLMKGDWLGFWEHGRKRAEIHGSTEKSVPGAENASDEENQLLARQFEEGRPDV